MFIIDTVKPEEAQGGVAEVYGMFPPRVGVPKPLQLFSASPGLLERQAGFLSYFMGHDTLSPALLAAIRFAAARRLGYTPCVELNGRLLCAMGMAEADLDNVAEAPNATPLEPGEAALLDFVNKALDAPESVRRADIDALCEQGWSQADILDALAHGANMAGPAALFKALDRD